MRSRLLVGLLIHAMAAGLSTAAGPPLSGEVRVDGSSTVYLITEAMATQFKALHPNVNLSVGISGTGGGFKKFAAGEIDINDASRPIRPAEAQQCQMHGIDYLELQVAWDGLAVVIHPENTWARKLTLEQLKKIWHPNSGAIRNAVTWSDVDPAWPREEIRLFGPGPDSGTFDFFTEAVNGKEKVIRTDYTASEDDNNLVQGIARNKYAIGFFGVAYYEANKQSLAAVAVAGPKGEGADYVFPEAKEVLARRYPLSRPLYLYVRTSALERPALKEFVQFYLRRSDLVSAANYVPLTVAQQRKEQLKLEKLAAK
jgi:phosphate transport system substrate-binding protein